MGESSDKKVVCEDQSYERLYRIMICAKRMVDPDMLAVCPRCGERETKVFCLPVDAWSRETFELKCNHSYHELIKELRKAMPFSESLRISG